MKIAEKLASLGDRFAVCMLKRSQSSHEGLSILSLRALALIHLSDEAPTMKQLANQLGVYLPNATHIIDRLETDEYVERHHDTHDKRVIRVYLTEKSQRFLKAHRDQHHALMSEALSNLEPSEQQAVVRFFEQCVAILERHK
jgi:DNA-binding MarR family transcriptional regulator